MTLADRWLLPDGVDEALPEQARKIEHLRRKLLNLHSSWGYQMVIPPLLEYLDSLLTGAGSDLEIETFKVIDQLSGRLLGIRADFTSQVARIDAHGLKESGVQRLCYCGSVLRTTPAGLDGTRSPIQLGAELYGHGGVDSDLEILSLMLETLDAAGLDSPVLDLGHVDIVREVMASCQLSSVENEKLTDLYKSKDLPELERYVASLSVTDQQRGWLTGLPNLCGGEEVLARAEDILEGAGAKVEAALEVLREVCDQIQIRFPKVSYHFDLSDLVSYSYHTGLVFAAYVPGLGNAVARGGRYNNIGEVFGRSRPATGFSTDLKTLVALSSLEPPTEKTVLAPVPKDPVLWQEIQLLRAQGYRVVEVLAAQPAYIEHQYRLESVQDKWQLVAV